MRAGVVACALLLVGTLLSFPSQAAEDAPVEGTTELIFTKHEPDAYRYGRGSMSCRFDPLERIVAPLLPCCRFRGCRIHRRSRVDESGSLKQEVQRFR